MLEQLDTVFSNSKFNAWVAKLPGTNSWLGMINGQSGKYVHYEKTFEDRNAAIAQLSRRWYFMTGEHA